MEILSTFRWKTPADQSEGSALIEKALQMLVQNTMSVVAVAALVHGGPTVMPKHALVATDYLHRKCALPPPQISQSGGTMMPATFFGKEEPMYSALNPSGGSPSTVDFAAGIARAEISQSGGAVAKNTHIQKWALKELMEYASHHGLILRKGAKDILVKVLSHYIICLNADLMKAEPVSVSKIHKLLKKKSFKVFV